MEEKKTNRLLLSNGCRNAGSSVSLLSATLAKKKRFLLAWLHLLGEQCWVGRAVPAAGALCYSWVQGWHRVQETGTDRWFRLM